MVTIKFPQNALPEFLNANAEKKAALVHIDVDVYEPTKSILEHMVDRVVPGGLILFDDYGTAEGETRAVDEFFDNNACIQKLPISHIPSFIKM